MILFEMFLLFFFFKSAFVFYQVSSVGRRQEIPEVTDSSWGAVRREEARRT